MSLTLLAIDTATENASVALYDEQRGTIAESSWATRANHTVELITTIVSMMQSQRVTPQQLGAVAVALGPGSFTGLRIGLAAAKGLCFSLGITIVGVPTLDTVAYAHYVQNLPICAILQAGRGRFCVALYEKGAEGWQRISDYRLATVEELRDWMAEHTLFCGEITPDLRASLTAQLGDRAVMPPPASSLRRAGYLAELGWQRVRDGGGDDLASLEPLYLHYPRIDERKNRTG